MVGHHIEISNRFLRDFEAATHIAKQCKALPCHKSPFAKGGFRGNVNVIEDISPPIATKKKEKLYKFPLLSSLKPNGLYRSILCYKSQSGNALSCHRNNGLQRRGYLFRLIGNADGI